ncbi:hypothetical protein [Sebaldella sp. S0638]|uniref:hypothetical protein n=1 Tax=Sebaldella sp. S0638 TaxID=2957809 RepID=UPI0020A1B3BD|nr:hypothetical protein [Sebaldella sp. S0638]MCP1225723.1 hypothetical protein [Sebaldella sp. S0638]
MANEIKKRPDYLSDDHLSTGTKEYLKVLNSGTTPVESLPPAEARKVLENAQSSVNVDLSGIDEEEKTIEADGFKIAVNITRPKGAKEKLPVFIF